MHPEPVIPALLVARVGDFTLALIRTHFHSEGSALLERVVDGDLIYVANGGWTIRGADEGPAVLDVDFDDSGDLNDLPGLLDRLLAEALKQADRLGFDVVARQGEQN